jgi:UDP-glucose 4-epimerase
VILVTGGAGFIGSHLVALLLEKGHSVRVFDNLATGKQENIPPKAEFFKGDITNTEDVKKASESVDTIFHLAAQVYVPLSLENPVRDAEINILGTLNLLEQNRDALFVYTSSAAVYGNTKEIPVKENAPIVPLSPYGVSKRIGEQCFALYRQLYGTKYAVTRTFNAYGPGQDPSNPYSGVISKFIDAAGRGEPLTIYGDGKQTRDFVYVGDVCDALVTCLGKEGTYNIGTGKETTLNELAELVKKVSGKDAQIVHEKEREGDILHSCADISRIKALGWSPKTTLEHGLKSMMM